MRLFCTLGWHSPGPQILWNAGFWFTKCRDCERDLVRSRHRGWHVPVGAKVVWQAKAPPPRPPAEPPMVVEPHGLGIAIDAPAPADPVPVAIALAPHETSAPSQLAELALPETASAETSPVETPPVATQPVEPQPLAPAERLDLAQFVAEMLHSAGPAVPIQHAVLGNEPGPLAQPSEDPEPAHGAAIETDSPLEGLASHEASVDVDLHDSGDAADDLAQSLVADPPALVELEEPLELVVALDADQLDVLEGEVPEAHREAGDAVAEPGSDAELAQTAPSHADATVLGGAVDPAAADAEAPASPAAAEPVPAAPAAEADPWADFLDDDDDDDDDFAWAQESRPQSPAAPRAAPERPAAPRAAPERPASGGERRGDPRLNEHFRSDIDGRKRWSKNSVKR